MIDKIGRKIEYLRLSVTQSCNLNCIYCSPSSIGNKELHCSSLTPDEFELIVRSMAKLGIQKVRITGGEPLTRPDLCEIISRISRIEGINDISMTTNGIKLDTNAMDLKRAGLSRINISLDSLNDRKFEYITGGGNLSRILKGIEMALEVGLNPVKINVVLIKGVNDDEIGEFIKLSKANLIEVRFIELMPVGDFGENNRDKIIYNSDIITEYKDLLIPTAVNENGPSKNYYIEGFKGRIGFISPMSHKFCDSCNRIRVTCDGKIRPCLGNNGEVDITDILHETPEKLDEFIKNIIFNKPEGHNFDRNFISSRGMNAIGG